ncbi:hypothetical protein MIND_00666000 [Mycena indigotica]|uniref:Uncharacterized protein n=1 Tax=Mycena indigotica TaxID=2126181 RepID=A0A8H6W107_9AGAR|nr:uncharacterized protein MIND_00666000 [Mycena indigotica]KAF7301022.1 hypothetical protein MIND_00666000 [Mycena indigotica]
MGPALMSGAIEGYSRFLKTRLKYRLPPSPPRQPNAALRARLNPPRNTCSPIEPFSCSETLPDSISRSRRPATPLEGRKLEHHICGEVGSHTAANSIRIAFQTVDSEPAPSSDVEENKASTGLQRAIDSLPDPQSGVGAVVFHFVLGTILQKIAWIFVGPIVWWFIEALQPLLHKLLEFWGPGEEELVPADNNDHLDPLDVALGQAPIEGVVHQWAGDDIVFHLEPQLVEQEEGGFGENHVGDGVVGKAHDPHQPEFPGRDKDKWDPMHNNDISVIEHPLDGLPPIRAAVEENETTQNPLLPDHHHKEGDVDEDYCRQGKNNHERNTDLEEDKTTEKSQLHETETGHYDETQDITARDENNHLIGRDVEAVTYGMLGHNDEFEDGNRAFIVASDKTPRKAVGAISQDIITSKPGQEIILTTSFPFAPVSFHVSVSPPRSTLGSKLAAQRREYKARHGHVSPDAASRKGKGRAVTADELFESSHITNTIENDPVAARLPAIFTDSVLVHPQHLFRHTAHYVAPGRLSFADIRQMSAASNHERGASQQVPSDTVTDSSIKADRRGRSQTAEVIMDARILVDLNGPCHQRAISDGTRCKFFPSGIPRPRGPISFPRRERSRADSGPASAAVNLVETRPFMPELAGDENEQPDPVNSQDIAPSEGPNLMHSNLSAFRSQMRLSELGPIAHISSSQIWATETPTTPPGSPLKSVDMPCKDSSTNASEQVNPLAQPILAVVAAESTEMTRSERIRHLPTHLRQQLGRDIESGDLTFLEECGPAVPVALVHSTALVPVAQIEAVKTGCTALNTTPSSGSLWSTTSRSYMSLSELGVGPSSTLTEALGKLPNADKLLGDFSPTKSRPVRIAPVGFSGEEEGSGLTRSERVDRLPAHYQGQHGNNVQSGDIVFLEDMHDGAGPRALAHSTGVSCAKVGGERAEDVMDSDMVEVVVKQAADNRQATFI